MKHLALAIWGLAVGGVLVAAFFIVVAEVSPRDVAAVTAAAGVICLLWLLRSVRLEFELRSRAGDPQLRAEYNRARERRGF